MAPKRRGDAEELVGIDKLLGSPKSILMIRALHEHGPMNMRTFLFYAHMRPDNATMLREWMEELGLLTVGKATVREGTTDLEIRLTSEGEEIARLLDGITPVLDRAIRKKQAAGKK